ncbi:hypothetical protein ACFWUU_04150 [Kribbella sp. NPDC058693]|uniref:hypothetical protein n=1 Tax=Kribbella sp. NPDC058693 TaxID=3346602 RepID=UPI003651385D
MDWQAWLAPTFVGVVLGIIATLVTGQLSRRHAEKMWHLQRKAQLEDAARAEGLKLADVALTQLNILSEDLPYTVRGRHSEERSERSRTALAELKRVTPITPDRALRGRLAIVQDVLSRPDDTSQWGLPEFDARQLVAIGTRDGISAVTAYIRGDDIPELKDLLRQMHNSYDFAMMEMAEQYEEQDRLERRADTKPHP